MNRWLLVRWYRGSEWRWYRTWTPDPRGVSWQKRGFQINFGRLGITVGRR